MRHGATAAILLSILPATAAGAQLTITEIIDETGDGQGHLLQDAAGLALDASGNVYVVGNSTGNMFRIAPDGVITEIIDAADRAPEPLRRGCLARRGSRATRPVVCGR